MALSQIETASLSSALVAPTATALTTASGSAPSYSARAWVNFNGTGTVVIRASGNVSSITDNGVGDYTVNFSTAMADANASYLIEASNGSASTGFDAGGYFTSTSAATAIIGHPTTAAASDCSHVNVAIFR